MRPLWSRCISRNRLGNTKLLGGSPLLSRSTRCPKIVPKWPNSGSAIFSPRRADCGTCAASGCCTVVQATLREYLTFFLYAKTPAQLHGRMETVLKGAVEKIASRSRALLWRVQQAGRGRCGQDADGSLYTNATCCSSSPSSPSIVVGNADSCSSLLRSWCGTASAS